MIKSITIRDVASYDHEGATFDNLQKVNIIYGGNGTGKTTLGRLLTDGVDSLRYENCRIDWCGEHDNWQVLTYNQDFRKENLKEYLPGLFTLGDDWVQSEDELVNHLIPMVEAYKQKEASEEEFKQLQLLSDKLGKTLNLSSCLSPSVDFINSILQQYGFTNFSIQLVAPDSNFYRIQRADGSFVNDTLSEGEVTFVTFLYYMQLAYRQHAEEDTYSKKILVIDDPISSLDEEVLGVVSSMVRKLMEQACRTDEHEIQQVFVMTHNVLFYRNIMPLKNRKDTCYFRLEKQEGRSVLVHCGSERHIPGGYEYKWQQLREEYNKKDSTLLPNIMRNIVETYFVVYGGYDKRKLFAGDYFDKLADRITANDLFKWLDEGSHGGEEELHSQAPQITNERYKELFRQFFAKMGHEVHYNMMMRINHD